VVHEAAALSEVAEGDEVVVGDAMIASSRVKVELEKTLEQICLGMSTYSRKEHEV
jgi:hypothetical protein